MKYKYRLAICLIALIGVFCLTEPLMADPLKDGVAAYIQGDYATALRLLKPLAEEGLADAQFCLGTMYEYGAGLPQNYAEAMKWYRKAAEQGYDLAMAALGYMYARRGVEMNLVQAHMWLNLAATWLTDKEQREKAAAARDHIASMMTPKDIAIAQDLATNWKPKAAAGEAPELAPESMDRVLARPETGAGETAREGVSILWENPALGREPTFMPKSVIPAWVSQAGLRLTVEFDFVLTPQGVLNAVRLRKSSGYSDVDSAVWEALLRWKFKPVASRAEVKGRVGYLILPR